MRKSFALLCCLILVYYCSPFTVCLNWAIAVGSYCSMNARCHTAYCLSESGLPDCPLNSFFHLFRNKTFGNLIGADFYGPVGLPVTQPQSNEANAGRRRIKRRRRSALAKWQGCPSIRIYHHHHHNRFTALFPGPPGWVGARREFWTLWCKGRLTEADTPTVRLGATPSGLTSAYLHHMPFFTDWTPFLPPNQQCQSTKAISGFGLGRRC